MRSACGFATGICSTKVNSLDYLFGVGPYACHVGANVVEVGSYGVPGDPLCTKERDVIDRFHSPIQDLRGMLLAHVEEKGDGAEPLMRFDPHVFTVFMEHVLFL